MASWFAGREIGSDNRVRLPPVEKKSKIPVRMTRLSSESNRSSSSADDIEKKPQFPRENMRPSRIPVVVEEKKSRADKKKPRKNMKPTEEQKPSGKHSGTVNIFLDIKN